MARRKDEEPGNAERNERRTRALLACAHTTLLYLGGMRIQEFGENTTGRIFCRRDANGEDRSWRVLGREVGTPVQDTAGMMSELDAYRRKCGPLALPASDETKPLITPIALSPKPLTRAALHRIATQVLRGTAVALRARGDGYAQGADQLEQASAQ